MENSLDTTLNEIERDDLRRMEAIVEAGLRTFLDVGIALSQIRDRRLYREAYPTFEHYCADHWNISRPRAYELMAAAEGANLVSGIPDIPPPTHASHATELARLAHDPSAARAVWTVLQREFGPKLTAAQVKDAVDARLGLRRFSFQKPDTAPPARVVNVTLLQGLEPEMPVKRVFIKHDVADPERAVSDDPAIVADSRRVEPEDDDAFNYAFFAHELWKHAYRETHPKRGGLPADEGIWYEEMDPSGIAFWSEEPAADAENWHQFAVWVSRVADALEEKSKA